MYFNDKKSELWFRARTNCLDLNNKKWKEEKNCVLCRYESETIEHFIMHCKQLEEIRALYPALQTPARQNDRETLKQFLYNENDIDRKKDVLMKMWRKRETTLNAMGNEQ